MEKLVETLGLVEKALDEAGEELVRSEKLRGRIIVAAFRLKEAQRVSLELLLDFLSDLGGVSQSDGPPTVTKVGNRYLWTIRNSEELVLVEITHDRQKPPRNSLKSPDYIVGEGRYVVAAETILAAIKTRLEEIQPSGEAVALHLERLEELIKSKLR